MVFTLNTICTCSVYVCFVVTVYCCHGSQGDRNEDEDITNRVFNGWRTEEIQEHGEGHPNSMETWTQLTLTIIHR